MSFYTNNFIELNICKHRLYMFFSYCDMDCQRKWWYPKSSGLQLAHQTQMGSTVKGKKRKQQSESNNNYKTALENHKKS